MITIGLTGGIGSGKTTVANYFIELGVPVYFADNEAKELMNTSKKIKKKLITEFGKEAYKDGKLNKAYLAAIVFNDKNKLSIINKIVHPEVVKHFSKWVKQQSQNIRSDYVIQENAILFENGSASKFNYIITVTAPVDIRINRILKRDSITKDAILSRMDNQWSDNEKVKLSDFVINNINLIDTKKQVKKLYKKLLKINRGALK
ncbi:MAG: dephospho-CoA kinase [Flavobacteriaceae bacterium]|nr:dephospho-CoA kinase [Flavobacteriaceae bacterium]